MSRDPFQCPACKHVHCTTGECQCDCDPVYEMHCRIAAAIAECEGILRHTVTLQVDDAHTRGYVAGMAQAARDIRAKLEGR